MKGVVHAHLYLRSRMKRLDRERAVEAPESKFRVDSHWLAMGGNVPALADGGEISAQAYITCSGEGCRLVLWFMPEDEALPPATCDAEGTEAALYLPFAVGSPFAELVRTTAPLYPSVSPDQPSRNCLKTSSEAAAGEML